MTIDRLAQMVRHIRNARRIEFREKARLLEAAVRHVAVFSAQTKDAVELASKITLFSEDGDLRLPNPEDAEPKSKLIIPDGVRSLDEPTKPQQQGQYIVVDTEEVPDAEDRRVVDEDAVASKNDGDKLMAFLGGVVSGR